MPCDRCPYGSQTMLVSAQVLAGITLVLSIAGWWLTWTTGIIAFALIMLLACTTVNRAVVITAGVFMCIASIGQIIFAVASDSPLNVYCTATQDDNTYYQPQTQNCGTVRTVFIGLGAVTAFGWFICATLTFRVSQTLRDKNDPTLSAWGNRATPAYPPKNTPAVMTGSAEPRVAVTVQQLPDGGRRIEKKIHNPDGSTTVTVTTEPPRAGVDAKWDSERHEDDLEAKL